MAKAVWGGYIAFGLVNIPVKLVSVEGASRVSFRLLCAKCKAPIKYNRVCTKCGMTLSWDQVVKGIEIRKGEYYVLTHKEIKSLRPESTNTIQILKFVDADSVDRIYFKKNYYVLPASGGEKAYHLFKEVLLSANKGAIGKFVMKEHEYICLITSYKSGLLLTTLHYEQELRHIEEFEELKAKPRLSPEEKRLANLLINKLSAKELDMSEYEDKFIKELKKDLKKKIEGKLVIKEKKKKPTKNLIEALKASV